MPSLKTPLLLASVLLGAGIGSVAAADWNAARDLKANELLGSPLELQNPNPTVPEWSYGYRSESEVASTKLTLFAASDHVNGYAGLSDLQGWLAMPSLVANTSDNPVAVAFCCGPLLPINPGEIGVWPGIDGTASVARWTAPRTGQYKISSYWRKTDLHGGSGCQSAVVLDGTVLYQKAWDGNDTPGYTNTIAITAGSVVDFLLGPNGAYDYDGSKFNATIASLVAGPLPAFGAVSATPGPAPIRSNNPWTFTATFSSPVAGLKLRVQSTVTPTLESSWADLQGNPYLTNTGSTWTLNTSDVPSGNRSFRVIASAPDYQDAVSTLMGPLTVLPAVNWDAARDLKENELQGFLLEVMNPNPTVPAWSYGYRKEASIAGTDLTLFTADEHVNNGADSPDLQGWYHPAAQGPTIVANTGANPVVLSFCCGPLVPINPGEVAVWPGNDGSAAVARWTAPQTAQYKISSYWLKTDLHGGGGCQSAVVLDGKVLYQQAWNGGDTPGYTNTMTILAGSILDFVMGPKGDFSFDGSKFNATIEPHFLEPLPAFGAVSTSPGFAPIRTDNPWTFAATYSSSATGLKLRVQSTLTPSDEGSWTDLPGNPYLVGSGIDWTLSNTVVPTGSRFFRVIAAAPSHVDSLSTQMGPFLVLPAIPPVAVNWNAAGDLRRNELIGNPLESQNPNPTIPEWSYGYRKEADLASKSLTLFGATEHVHNGGGSVDLQGWYRGSPGDGPTILADVGNSPVILAFCCGALLPINPDELGVWPASDGFAAVTRWTVPQTGKYSVSAYWRKTDLHGGSGCQSAVVADGVVLYQQAWNGSDTPGYTNNTLQLSAGAVVDFVLGPNGDYSFDGSKFNATIQLLSLADLPAINSVSLSAGSAPIRSSNPWMFTAVYSSLVSGLKLRVQSTVTPDDPGSWTDLPGNPYMASSGDQWTLRTTDVPTGLRFFRVTASAPNYTDGVSTKQGPFSVLEGTPPFGEFTWQTTAPFQTGVPWIFTITQPSLNSTMHLRVQSSSTPADPNSWVDLSDGGQMTRQGSTWTLTTASVPGGTQAFRVLASAPDFLDRISNLVGPFSIRPSLPPVSKSFSKSGKYSVLDVSETQSPDEVFLQAVGDANIQFALGLPFNPDFAKLTSALVLAAEQYAKAELQIVPGQNLSVAAVNVGPNSALELKGIVTGDVSLLDSLVARGGAAVVAQGGGNFSHDLVTAALINQDGSSLINQDGSGLIHQDGSGLIHQDGSGAKPPAPLSRRRIPLGLGPVQPAFTGVMTVDGNYNQFSGTLYMGIAGTNSANQGAQQFDQLVVSGTATLSGGNLSFGLFDPQDQTNRSAIFLPPSGSTFDVIVATRILISHAFGLRGSAVWGDGLFFKWAVVDLPEGRQALRLTAASFPPFLSLSRTNGTLQLSYPINYTGYAVESSPTLASPSWSSFSTGTNVITLTPGNSPLFFRLSGPSQ